ncbi:MBL fold metallo-hydrolase [Planktothrix paucivesiculata]|uniref:Beta-lactamase-like protein n=1 Tax=Planktothrix paucivesiculata PCC 9631 TaxID=671071 RepID=A0A7Z9BXW8_9CYAN|nr:Beta-lactamase-like protein [Planktothrix paucivesiculata PCC 9631]
MPVSDPRAQNPHSSDQVTPMDKNSATDFSVRFWGVRGSIPTPGAQTVEYGGNTSCVEMRLGEKRLIFDAGTGLRVLGMDLLKQMPVEAYMFFSHTHWDHIQGFPFFVPAFIPINRFHIYGAIAPDGSTIKDRLCDQMVHPNFPVPIHVMQSDMKFYDLFPGDTLTLDDIKIETAPLNHPNGAVGYRVTWQGKTAVYCTDTEHFPDHFDKNVLHLARDADVFIYDATYTNEEYHNHQLPRIGWGHSTWEVGVELAKKAGVKQVVMYQHDPSHTDEILDRIEAQVQAVFPKGVVAREGMILNLD